MLIWEASAVAQAAVEEGVAAVSADDFDALRYREELEGRLGQSYALMRSVINQVRGRGKRIVFPEGIRNACSVLRLNCPTSRLSPHPPRSARRIQRRIEHLGLEFDHTIVNPRKDERRKGVYAPELAKRRARKGVTLADAERLLKSRPYFGSSMLRAGDADGMVGGVGRTYADVLKPAIQSLGTHPEGHCIVGCYVVSVAGRLIILADATVNIYPDQRTLAEIAVQTSRVARRFGLEPRVACSPSPTLGPTGNSGARDSKRPWPPPASWTRR